MSWSRILAAAVLLGVILAAPGCGKKATTVPPATQPEPSAGAPAPAPAPEPEAPAAPALSSDQLRPVYFAFDSVELSGEAQATLDGNARLLRTEPGPSILIEGHCDERGTTEYNLALGERRAQVTRDYLVAAGIEASRISIISYGEERPFASGSDEAAWAQNRRAHFVVR